MSFDHRSRKEKKNLYVIQLFAQLDSYILIPISIKRSPTNNNINTKIVGLQDLTGPRRKHDLHISEWHGHIFLVEECLIEDATDVATRIFGQTETTLQGRGGDFKLEKKGRCRPEKCF